LNLEEKKVHTSCFKCSLCRKQLADGEFFELEGKAYCKSDYELEKRLSNRDKKASQDNITRSSSSSSSSSSNTNPTTTTKVIPASTKAAAGFGSSSSNTSSSKIFENDDEVVIDVIQNKKSDSSSSSSQKCEYCGEPIEGKRMNFGMRVYHEACFKCSNCFSPIPPEDEFKQGKLGIVCLKCSSRACSVCKQVIAEEETPHEFYGEKMHLKCFKCYKCNCVLDPKNSYEFRRKPYCLRDYSAARVS